MNELNNEIGFGYIGIIITLAIIAIMVWGAFYIDDKNNEANQIQQGQIDIQKAKDAAQQQNDYNQSTQNEINSIESSGTVNYGSVRDKANSLK